MDGKKLRRSGRIRKSVPILLIGSDTEGRVFTEQTRTVILSLHGAGVISSHKLLAEQELILRSLETNREAEIRVVGEIGAEEDKHTYGVAFLDDSLDFWEMEFPPPPPAQERPVELQLECTACGDTVTLLNGDYEFDVCAIHGGLVRYCGECGFATVWKRPESGTVAPARVQREPRPSVRPSAQLENLELEWWPEHVPVSRPAEQTPMPTGPVQRAQAPGAEDAPKTVETRKTATAVEERRQRVRAKVNYFACVGSEAFGDDVVTCIDMSRGGLGFWSRNAYLVSTEVKIAVPFAPESPNTPAIFVAARVVNIAELPGRQMFRCGVMFLPAKGAQAHT